MANAKPPTQHAVAPTPDIDPTDAEVSVTNPERDRWRRIVEEQRKDIRDLVRQLERASRDAAYWQTVAELGGGA